MVGRSWFGTHAWIEVFPQPFNPLNRVVLDATTGIPSPEKGTKSRTQYKTAHIDQAADPTNAKTGNLSGYVRGPAPSTGNCCKYSALLIGSITC